MGKVAPSLKIHVNGHAESNSNSSNQYFVSTENILRPKDHSNMELYLQKASRKLLGN